MNTIQNNPYRILGVYSNSSTRERLANLNRMKAFLRVGRPVSVPLDLPQFPSSVSRTEEIVAKADAELTLPKDQMLYAQFWFIKDTPLDEVAFKNLIDGDMAKAEEIWKKKECVSSLQNRIVCAIIRKDYALVIFCAETLYNNASYVNQFISAVVGTGVSFNAKDLAFSFLDVLCEEVGASNLLPYITNSIWKKYIGEKSVEPLIDTIQKAIDVAKKSRGKGPKARLNAGETLMKSTKDALLQLMGFLSVTDVQYQMIADKLAQEILQCGIDYYNDTDDDDAPKNAMNLQKYALSIAIGALVKGRCKENVDILAKVGPEYIVRKELARVTIYLKNLKNDSSTIISRPISDIKEIILKCTPDVESMKMKLGCFSDLYVKVSSTIVSSAVNALVEIVNFRQALYGGNPEILRPIISEAITAMDVIGKLDMDTKTRDYYNSNNSTLREINGHLNPTDSGACYIATMAYGDYGHPQVLVLRHFRDLYLAQKRWGKWFIQTYYKYSPSLVEKLRNHTLINKLIKKLLDGFISMLKNKYKQ